MSTAPPDAPATRTLNIRVPAQIYEELEELAQAGSRSKTLVTIDALVAYLEAERWQIQDISDGLADADRGDFASEAEVARVFERYGA